VLGTPLHAEVISLGHSRPRSRSFTPHVQRKWRGRSAAVRLFTRSTSAVRLRRLTLENFRGFESLDLELHPQLTVLVGANGSGKTSILEALVAMLDRATYEHESDEDTPLVSAFDTRLGRRGFSIGLDVDVLDEPATFRIDEGGKKKHDLTLKLREALDAEPAVALCAYSVLRHVTVKLPNPPEAEEYGFSVDLGLSKVARQWLGRSDFSPFFAWFLRQEDIENELRRDQPAYRDPTLEVTRKAIEGLMPGYTSLRVRRAHTKTPRFTLTKGDQELDFDRLSEGERALAVLVGDIARRTTAPGNAPDPAKNKGIVIIDEIDLHLHPKWQANVLPALLGTFPEIQFIVTTHSPLVLSQVDAECVRLLQDFRLLDVPPTRGRDPNSVLTEVFGVPLRPVETQAQIDHIAELIDEEQLDEAKQELRRLGEQLGSTDLEVTRLRGLVELMEA
jgi:predicted ATPase